MEEGGGTRRNSVGSMKLPWSAKWPSAAFAALTIAGPWPNPGVLTVQGG